MVFIQRRAWLHSRPERSVRRENVVNWCDRSSAASHGLSRHRATRLWSTRRATVTRRRSAIRSWPRHHGARAGTWSGNCQANGESTIRIHRGASARPSPSPRWCRCASRGRAARVGVAALDLGMLVRLSSQDVPMSLTPDDLGTWHSVAEPRVELVEHRPVVEASPGATPGS
jgi:hypothetical protein